MKIFKFSIAISIIIIILAVYVNKVFAIDQSIINNVNNLNTPANEAMLGDLNNDKIVDTKDIILLMRHISASKTQQYTEWLLKDEYLKIADLTGDGKIDDEDSVKLLRYVSASNSKTIADEHPDWLELKVGQNTELEISNIYINKSETVLGIGNSEQLIPIIVPTNAKSTELTWESSNSEIVEVNENGIITGKNPGTAIIKLKAKNGMESECLVNVVNVEGVDVSKLSNETIALLIGQSQNSDNVGLTTEQQTEETAQQQALASHQEHNALETQQQQQALETQQQAIAAQQQQQALEAQQTIAAQQQQQALETLTPEQQESIIEVQRRIIAEQQQALTNPTPIPTPIPTPTPEPTVEPTPTPEIEAAGIAIEGAQTLDLNGVKSKKLSYIIRPLKTTNKTVTWSSSDPSVVEVNSSTGEITAKKNGEATITATTVNNKKGTCKIKVITSSSGVKLSTPRNNILIGTTVQLIATVEPSTVTNSDLKWKSSDNSIATVNGYGLVTARGNGSVIITATTVDGSNKSGTITIDVGTYPTRITLSKTSEKMDVGKKLKLSATISPPIKNLSPGYDKVTWESSDNNVATVSSNGEVTAKRRGTVTITAKTKNNIKQTCKITIAQPVTKVTLNKKNITLKIGQNSTETLKATVEPNDANDKTINWKTSNSNIATVDKNGKVVAKGPGTATITASAKNGASDTCKVTVKQGKISVLFIGNSKTFFGGGVDVIFKNLAEGAGKSVYAERVLAGGPLLYTFTEEVKSRIRSRKWDYIVLQEQSETSAEKRDVVVQGCKAMTDYTKQNSNSKVVPILNSMFPLVGLSQDATDANFRAAQKVCGGIVAYSGKTFALSSKKYPNIQVYGDDGRHATDAGYYISACSTYAAIYNESPTRSSYHHNLGADTAKKLQKLSGEVMGVK